MTNPAKTFVAEWKDSDTKEKAFMVAGGFFLAAAIVGIFLPIVPQVPFAIIAAFLFSKGNRRLYRWIRRNKYIGPPVKDWEDHRVMRPKLKVFSTVAMIGGAAIGHWQLKSPWFWILDAVFAIAIIFVVSRKSSP